MWSSVTGFFLLVWCSQGPAMLEHVSQLHSFLNFFFNFIFYLKKIFYWSIVDLQCCVSFRCAAKGISCTYTHVHISTLFFSCVFVWFLFQSNASFRE